MSNVAAPSSELEDLESMLTSPGWAWTMGRFQQEWGRSGTRYLDLLERMANTTEAGAAEDMKRVIFVRKELEGFFSGITAHYQKLKNARLPNEAGQSRRGVL